MPTINQLKQQGVSDTPLVLFECLMAGGHVERWSTHDVMVVSEHYAPRVLRHDLFEMQLSADDAMDGITQLSLTLANADSVLSELNAAIGFKGAQLTVYFGFADLRASILSSERIVLFRGIAGDPDEITEASLTLSFLNKLSLQKVPVPEVRIQRNCPWMFPTSIQQRSEAVNGGKAGRFSRFYRCGYSADLPGGAGSLNGGVPFVSCDKSRTQCIERGMFDVDASGNATRRFGGFEFVPSVTNVRSAGDKTYHLSPLLSNSAKYNDPVPLVYGTGWLKAPLIFARNDGNLTHMEVVLASGNILDVLKVIVNDVEIPHAVDGGDMTATGWYSPFASGSRVGSFNLTFVDDRAKPLGDPYGSIAMLSVVVPNRICTATSLPTIQVLMQGLLVDIFGGNGEYHETSFSNNPAWVVLDLLQRCGWATGDLDVASFASAAAYCEELISTTDSNGNTLLVPRYGCNIVLTKRQSASSVIRGIRVASSLMLRYGANGLLQLLPETTIAAQRPTLPDGSNSVDPINRGWPTYEFSDSSASFSGIVRRPDGSSSLKITSRNIAEISNRLSVEFQDEANEYQQDSLSVVSQEDLSLIGYEVSSQSTAVGLPNYNQASRVLLRQLDKLTKGNLFVEFQASFQAIKIRPGDIVTITYVKDGFDRVPFRVTKVAPSLNYQVVTILAQIHNDDWYSDSLDTLEAAGRQPSSQIQIPRPLIGLKARLNSTGLADTFDFEVDEVIQANRDGSATDTIAVAFAEPSKPGNQTISLPLLSLAPGVQVAGGSLPGGQTYYYAVTANDSAGTEGSSSFVVRAQIPNGSSSNAVSITQLSFPRTAQSFNVYRGGNPQSLYRIASGVELSDSFTDIGLTALARGLPDSSFDHANFYYRYEYAGPFSATGASTTTISCQDMGAVDQAYFNMTVRIIAGAGAGQERQIAANDATVITTSSRWTIIPDSTSKFVIAEGSWNFAAVSSTSPAKFQIPFRAGTVLQISGRGANVLNQESSPDLCPLTRVPLGRQHPDGGAPGTPTFMLNAPGAGELTLSAIGFADATNVGSVASGTLSIYFVDELAGPSTLALRAALDPGSRTVLIAGGSMQLVGSIVQIGTELLSIVSFDSSMNAYTVLRGVLGSKIAAHSVSDRVWPVQRSVIIVPFASNFFENRASINYIHPFALPDSRVAASEFFVTNSFGDSQTQQQCYTGLPSFGLRTLSGGQLSLQTNGSITTQQNVAPPLIIEADHAVRDVRAVLGRAAQGYSVRVEVLQDTQSYCSLQIAANELASLVLDGVGLAALRKLSSLRINIFLQPIDGFQGTPLPPRDLTVNIRF
ncbi:MAG: phage tail protein [Bryobacteraceae bacterium]